eukprot:GHVU01150124.1.p2 GENE.GHVU01150124.1~~GHVU01150124.1.p2  ORF type:complete len:129 (-),score=33.84 GHVU01150124.1:16-402(-)
MRVTSIWMTVVMGTRPEYIMRLQTAASHMSEMTNCRHERAVANVPESATSMSQWLCDATHDDQIDHRSNLRLAAPKKVCLFTYIYAAAAAAPPPAAGALPVAAAPPPPAAAAPAPPAAASSAVVSPSD